MATDSAPSRREALRDRWQRQAVEHLPPLDDVLARNESVTGTYAGLYASRPELFKWAGMAAFSSHKVGVALSPYALESLAGQLLRAKPRGSARTAEHIHLPDLELLRSTNNRVFDDIGWAHVAYAAQDGGIAAIEEALAGDADATLLLAGFRTIERARVLFEEDPASEHATDLAWEGNLTLLRHEQYRVVQPQFERMTPAFRVFLDVATSVDFDADEIRTDTQTLTLFTRFMWTRGLPVLLRTFSLPNIANAEHRWAWASGGVAPLFRTIEKDRDATLAKMERLRRGFLRDLVDG